MTQINWGIVAGWLVFPAVLWGIIIYVVGGSGALGFYVRLILVLTAISIIGTGIGWVWDKIGGSIND